MESASDQLFCSYFNLRSEWKSTALRPRIYLLPAAIVYFFAPHRQMPAYGHICASVVLQFRQKKIPFRYGRAQINCNYSTTTAEVRVPFSSKPPTHSTNNTSSTGMSSTGAFVPVAGATGCVVAESNGPITSTGGTSVQQPPPPLLSSTMSTRQRSAETPNDEEVAAIGPSLSTLLRVTSPLEIPDLSNLGRLDVLGDVGAVAVTSTTSVSAATGNHSPLSSSTTTTGTQPTARTASGTRSITSTTSTMSPSLVFRRSPRWHYVSPSCSFLPAATGKSSTATTAISTPGVASPVLLVSHASYSANHHQQSRGNSVDTSVVAASSFMPIGSSSTPPRKIACPSLPRVAYMYTTPKTNGTSSAAVRVPDAPKKQAAAGVSNELLAVAAQERMRAEFDREALARTASTEEPNQVTQPLPSTRSTEAAKTTQQSPARKATKRLRRGPNT